MNNYLFRGKPTPEALENHDIQEYIKDGWVYGNLIWNNRDPWIVGDIVDWSDEHISLEWWVPVVPETIGQFTGELIRNTTEIFQWDIIEVESGGLFGKDGKAIRESVEVFVVKFNSGRYFLEGVRGENRFYKTKDRPSNQPLSTIYFMDSSIKVLGNIHDNPELLKE